MTRAGLLIIALMAVPLLAAPAVAQQPDRDLAERPLATRAQLEELAKALDQHHDRATAERVRARLDDGDFRPGDRILLMVQGESTLSDTFTVGPNAQLALPSPTVGALALHGVLRSELPDRMMAYLSRFLAQPVVQTRAMVRLSVQGEVARAGYYNVPADAAVAEVVMAAGGTTHDANVDKVRIERDGRKLWEGRLQVAAAGGRTVDESLLRDGDQLVVPRRRMGTFEGNMRFAWLLVSITAGVLAISHMR